MKHVVAIAGRELQSLFVSPVAYVVLTLWAVTAGTFFLSSVMSFDDQLAAAQQARAFEYLETMNLSEGLILPFIGSMWIVLLFVCPAVTMGLFANEKANGTEELLLTSPVTIWEIVLGKFAATGVFVFIMTLIVAFFPGILFLYGDPELGRTLSGLTGLFLVSLAYVAVGGFASSLTRNQLIAFVLTVVLLLVLFMMLPFMLDTIVGRGALSGDSWGAWISSGMRYIGTGEHFENLLRGLVETKDLAYFAVVIGIFLLLTKTTVESVRWR